MRREWLITNESGFLLVEIILSSAVFVLLVTALVGAYLYGEESTALSGNRARATLLAEEALEATQNIRDAGFSNLIDGVYGLTTTSNQWNLFGLSDATDIFTRQVIISTVDAKRKSATASVTWQQNPQRTGAVSLVTRLANWLAYKVGNWASPIQEASIDASGSQNGIKIQISGNYAYVVRNGGINFLVVDISTPESPSITGSLALDNTPTNIAVSGNYAYISNTDNSQELQIIDITNPASPNVTGIYNAPGNANATGVFVSGTTVYLTRASSAENEFSIINASVPGSPTLIGSLDLGANANEVVISGNYAYIASANNSQELQVINITTPASPILAGSLNLSGNTDASTIAVAGGAVFLGQGSILYTIDASTPTTPTTLGSVGTSDNLNDIALNFGNGISYIYVATSDNSLEFQVIDANNPSSPTLLGSVNTAGNDDLNGIAYNETLDRAFGVGNSNSEEFFVLAPQ